MNYDVGFAYMIKQVKKISQIHCERSCDTYKFQNL